MDGKNKYFMKIKTIFYLNVVAGWNSGCNIMTMTSTTKMGELHNDKHYNSTDNKLSQTFRLNYKMTIYRYWCTYCIIFIIYLAYVE